MSEDKKTTSLGMNFNAREVDPHTPFEAVSEGWHKVEIKTGDVARNDGEQGRRLNLGFKVLEGPDAGKAPRLGMQFVHSNPQTQRIGASQVSAICHATNVLDLQDASQLFGKIVEIMFRAKPERYTDADGIEVAKGTPGAKYYGPSNEFGGARPVGAVSTGAHTPAPVPVAPPPVQPGAPVVPPPNPNGASVTPAPAPSGGKKRPGRPSNAEKKAAEEAAKAAAGTAPQRKFYLGLEGPEWEEKTVDENTLIDYFKQGMPADTAICLEGDESGWHDAAFYKVGQTPAPAAVVPPPAPVAPPPVVIAAPPAPVTPPPAAAPGAFPWQASGGAAPGNPAWGK